MRENVNVEVFNTVNATSRQSEIAEAFITLAIETIKQGADGMTLEIPIKNGIYAECEFCVKGVKIRND